MANPFHYGTPVEGLQFTGRTEELDTLVARMRSGVNVVLVSPRRYGKTSLHLAAQARLTRGRPRAALIDVNVLRANSVGAFAGLLTSGAFHLRGTRWSRARQAVPEFLRRVRVTPSVTFDTLGQPRFGFDAAMAAPDAETVIADVYRLLAEEAERRPSALILDEFQAIGRHGVTLPDLFKSLADEHPAVSLVLAGSKRHLMEEMVLSARAPLYGMAERLALGPIAEADMVAYLCRRASETGRRMEAPTAAHLVAVSGPVPNDIQRLAFEAWEVAEGPIDDATVDRAFLRAVGHDAAFYAESLAHLSHGQGRVLAAIADEPPKEPYSAGFARTVGLASGSSVRKALQPLVAEEVVVEREGRLGVADPYFAAWLTADPTERGPS